MKRGLCLLALLGAPASARAADPSALWNIINGKCVVHEEATHDPSPCAEVDLADGVGHGYAVLKDIRGVAQFLLLPTARISGIEDPQILAPNAVNYWDKAWHSRYFTEERLGAPQPRDVIILAINSAMGRTQNQLHIHIDCVRPDVRVALAANLERVTGAWTPFPVPLAGHSYQAIRIGQERLDGVNPFKVLADGDAQAAADMGEHTLALVGEDFPDGTRGFVLLDDKADAAAGDFGSAEELQDHSCKIAGK